MKQFNLFFLFGFLLILSSCSTYHMTTESLLTQMANTNPENKKTFVIAPPFFIPFEVTGNSLRKVKVLDKDNKEVTLNVTHRTGIRVWKKDGTKKTFYMNTLLVKDSLITGKNDHFIGTNIKPINLNNIDHIELQE